LICWRIGKFNRMIKRLARGCFDIGPISSLQSITTLGYASGRYRCSGLIYGPIWKQRVITSNYYAVSMHETDNCNIVKSVAKCRGIFRCWRLVTVTRNNCLAIYSTLLLLLLLVLLLLLLLLLFQIPIGGVGWSVPPKDLGRNTGPISHPQKIPSKYWVLKIHGRNSKEHNYPRSL